LPPPKKNHPVAPKEVVNVFGFEYRGVEKDFSIQNFSLLYKKDESTIFQ
jgi:hypothetical protein